MIKVMKRCAASLLAGIFVAGCADGPATPLEFQPQHAVSTGAVLVECPSDVARSTTGTIGPLGGALELDGTRITIPALALLLPTEFRLTLPASKYMEVEVRAGGAEHFSFEVPVSIAIDYSRCSRSNIDKEPLRAWHIDTQTKALLEDMGGVDDKTARTVTFQTDHLSGFSIAQ